MSSYQSDYSDMLNEVFEHMRNVMAKVGSGEMSAEDGEAVAKAGHVATKTVEIDLHARVFAHKVEQRTPRITQQAA